MSLVDKSPRGRRARARSIERHDPARRRRRERDAAGTPQPRHRAGAGAGARAARVRGGAREPRRSPHRASPTAGRSISSAMTARASSGRSPTADAVLMASPVYRGSYTGALKNLLDLTPVDALRNKPVGIVAMGATLHHYLGVDGQLRWSARVVRRAGPAHQRLPRIQSLQGRTARGCRGPGGHRRPGARAPGRGPQSPRPARPTPARRRSR